MGNIVLQVENISKRYRLGVLNADSLKEDLVLWWRRKLKQQPDPTMEEESCFWALRDINFEIKKGDVVGIIGKNGAGKSTLLKIISRIALPTTGIIRGKGRMASLLEVGTGFHPELSGRENIFLNGNILGMSKKEIERRFDEIVDFSGVSEFLDTPVKRYSSGMYVRLAFSIAIHLEPDILVLDEVLSVGDYDFQQKCLAKIDEISRKQGQTILFVSHNMQSVSSLCNTALYLEKGRLVASVKTSSVIPKYLTRERVYVNVQRFPDKNTAPGNDIIRINEVELLKNDRSAIGFIDGRDTMSVRFSVWNLYTGNLSLEVGITVTNFLGEAIFSTKSTEISCRHGIIHGMCQIPSCFLVDGQYVINLVFLQDKKNILYEFDNCLSFEIRSLGEPFTNAGKWQAPVHPKLTFKLSQLR